ncbi:MAG TPA: EamA family transporter, partial [Propionicimonas sp.]
PLLMNRGVNGLIMLAAIGFVLLRSRAAGDGGAAPILGAGGVRLGDLSVIGVLTALYPAGTILLAATVLKERIAPVQWAGLALALVATSLLAA